MNEISMAIFAIRHSLLFLLAPAKTPGCKWGFHIKRIPDGFIKRYKAHLIARRFQQHFGINYVDVFSAIIKLGISHNVLSMAVSHGCRLSLVGCEKCLFYMGFFIRMFMRLNLLDS